MYKRQAVQRANRVEDGRLRQPPALARGAGELGGEHVEKNLGVARRVEDVYKRQP